MILTEKVIIKTNGKSIEYYRNLGYEASHNKEIEVSVSNLSNGSFARIDVQCDTCKIIKNMFFATYTKCVKNRGFYCCNKCKGGKTKKTCQEKYGVDNISQLEFIKDKKEETCMKNYGVTNPSHSQKIIDKIKKTFLTRYGVKSALENKLFNSKMRETMKLRYGVIHALHHVIFLQKSKNTSLRKYNVESITKLKEFQLRVKKTKIERGYQNPDESFSDFVLYKRRVTNITNKIKKCFMDNWNGIDFYDGECIKDNFVLYKPRTRNYPSIDHKISIMYGFLNDIDEKMIGGMENLCITKTHINISKKAMHFEQFIEKLKIKPISYT